MSDLRELYQQMIVDHGKKPRNFCVHEEADYVKEGHNPLCGDQLTVYVSVKNDIVEKATFYGAGCAISMASASLMTEAVKGKTFDEVHQLFDDF